ncbi:hypothetical protein FACS189487_06190 [Campylobacterota bacterium]|nr:hypothetical protein FACS189487_06190 [Campylobacterota bacterium]
MEAEIKWVWVFQGEKSRSCSAIFSDRSKAEIYIKKYALSGLLEKMPIDKSIYDWAIESECFKPQKDYQSSAAFIQQFASSYLEHYHYEKGDPH